MGAQARLLRGLSTLLSLYLPARSSPIITDMAWCAVGHKPRDVLKIAALVGIAMLLALVAIFRSSMIPGVAAALGSSLARRLSPKGYTTTTPPATYNLEMPPSPYKGTTLSPMPNPKPQTTLNPKPQPPNPKTQTPK